MIMEEVWGKVPAFVVIDVQKKFYLDRADWEQKSVSMVRGINEVAAMFREAGRPVIFVRFNGPTCRPYDGPDGDDFLEGLEVCDGDIIVEKNHMNSFLDTDLEERIRSNGCDTAVLSGVVAQYCVMSTYFAAFDHNIKSYLAEGTYAGTTQELEDSVSNICKVLTKERLGRFLTEGK